MATETNTLSVEKQKEILNEFQKFNTILARVGEGEERLVKLSNIHHSVVNLPESVYPGANSINQSVVKRLKQTVEAHADNINSYNESLVIIKAFIFEYPEVAKALPNDFAETFFPI